MHLAPKAAARSIMDGGQLKSGAQPFLASEAEISSTMDVRSGTIGQAGQAQAQVQRTGRRCNCRLPAIDARPVRRRCRGSDRYRGHAPPARHRLADRRGRGERPGATAPTWPRWAPWSSSSPAASSLDTMRVDSSGRGDRHPRAPSPQEDRLLSTLDTLKVRTSPRGWCRLSNFISRKPVPKAWRSSAGWISRAISTCARMWKPGSSRCAWPASARARPAPRSPCCARSKTAPRAPI